ncbi:MAG: ATP-binding protein [Candidatus Promineifilaceae bacterium]
MAEKILVVDDGQHVRDFLAEYILSPQGYDVIMATNGQEGLEKALLEKPDLMIVDNQMPRMSGIEMLRALRDQQIEIPAILTTAYGSEETAVEAFRLGVRDYVIKPFDASTIKASIERALREGRLRRERDHLLNQVLDSNTKLERRVQELNTLYGIGKSVAASLDLEKVLHRVVEAAVYITNADEGFLMLLDEDRGELYVRASKNLDSAAQSMRLRVRDSLAGQVLTTNRPVVVGDEKKWEKIKTAYLARSLVYVPLTARDESIGVLSIVNRVKETKFTRRDSSVLTTLAAYATVAIRNAHLYETTDQERHKLETILTQTGDPILVIDSQERIVLANGAAQQAFNLDTEEVLGQKVDTQIKNDVALEFIKQPVDRDFHQREEITLEDGRIFNASMSFIEGVGRSIVMQDITHLKELDKLKSEFVSVVSHDLRSPLTSILGYVQLLERAGELNDAQKEFVKRVHYSVDNITSLIGDLLDLGRLETGLDLTLTSCSLNEIILQVVEDVQVTLKEKRLKLILDLTENDQYVQGDRKRLHQAYNNLVSNAIKYTPSNGKIGIRMQQKDGQVITQIEDTGIGIPLVDQPYIFDKFFRSEEVKGDYQGSGLGLSIVKSVVERHNGRVWVASTPGGGTTFTVVLPLIKD